MAHRKAIRVTVGTSDVDVPLGVFAAGQTAQYDGTQFKGVNGTVGPVSVGNGDLAMFSGTSGAVLADAGILAANVATGPASAVSGNIASFNGTSGKVVQDSGVSATAHAARHIPGGADSVFPGTYSAGDIPTWNGSAWAPKLRTTVRLASTQTTPTTIGPTTPQTVLSIATTRAGNYCFLFMGQWASGAVTAMTMGMQATYTGTISPFVMASDAFQTAAGAVQSAQTAALATTIVVVTSAAVAVGFPVYLFGSFTASTAGTFTILFNKQSGASAAGNTYSILGGAYLEMKET